MGTIISISGQPLVRFVFDYIPSTNEAVNKARTHWSKGHHDTKKWRSQGEDLARRFINELVKQAHWKISNYLIRQRAFVWLRVYRAAEWPTYDVPNPYVKPIMDGFTDAGVWADDDWPNVPYVMFSWVHADNALDESGKSFIPDLAQNYFFVEVHELAEVWVNGVAQILPSGRFGPRGD